MLATVAVPCPERIQTAICRTCVVLSSLLLIVRMIYQIKIIEAEGWAANCSVRSNTSSLLEKLMTKRSYLVVKVSFLVIVCQDSLVDAQLSG